ncbi:MAG: fructosamine kinase family protein [Sphingobacteriales bacterium]|nr:fructosamine kinase family protein [Sphingobacteriales bacterium]
MLLLQPILDDCGLSVLRAERVHGGDINEAWCLYTAHDRYFLKVNNADLYPDMFLQEAAGLSCLKKAGRIYIPSVIKTGIAGSRQYLLLEWIEKGHPGKDFWENFGRNLARLHLQPQNYFGWITDNYAGRLKQCNKRHDTWDEFYTECRIMPLVEILFNKNLFNRQDIKAAGQFCNQLDTLFPVEPPSLLHGDLWSGNYRVTPTGQATIFDPAVYFGHREMDLGMTQLFGGFDPRFYNAYHEMYPLEHGWESRLKLTEAYPLLVHAVLFGGLYVNRARDILHYFNEWP